MTRMRLNKNNIIVLAGILAIYFLVYGLQFAGVIGKFQEINLIMLGINIILAVSLNLIQQPL